MLQSSGLAATQALPVAFVSPTAAWVRAEALRGAEVGAEW